MSNENSLLEYRKRVVDEISPSFCGAKWFNATIWLGHGQTASCHHPPSHAIDLEELKDNPSAIHNTKHKKEMRKMMLNGVRPNECEYCWKIEDMGKDHISDRVMKSLTFTDEENFSTEDMGWDADVNLKTLEISFDRTCNFSCSYCNPSFSSSWVKDIKKNGPYQNITSDGRDHYVSTHEYSANAAAKEEDNPYIQAFWKWFNSELQYELRELRITGGEPLMAASVWKLFDWFRDNPERAETLKYAINSNLVPKKELMDRLVSSSKSVPFLDIYTSQEATGAIAEYIRDGLDYDQWLANVERLITEGKVNQIVCMSTINSLCLPGLVDFMETARKIKRKYGRQYLTTSLNMLRFPSFQAVAILPPEIKSKYKIEIENWYKEIVSVMKFDLDPFGIQLYSEWELSQIERLIDYLDVIKTPHSFTATTDKLYNDFRQFFLQYDQRRGKNFREVFPKEYVDFIDSIPDPTPDESRANLIPLVHVQDPAPDHMTGGGYISDELKNGKE